MTAQAIDRPALPAERVFYLSMIGAIWAVTFVGFGRSIFLRPFFPAFAAGHTPHEPYFYVHGALFFAWLALLATQGGLISARRVSTHRTLGIAGFVMVPLMVLVAGFGALIAAHRPTGFVDVPVPPLQFLTTPWANLVVFGTLCGLGLALRRDPQTHKRLMLLGTIAIAEGSVSRIPIDAISSSPQAVFWLTAAFVIPMVAWDFASRRRIHPATLWGGLMMALQGPVRDFVATTGPWLAFATWATGLLG
jgi:hypothetical protein